MMLVKAVLLILSCGGLVFGSLMAPASISGTLQISDLVVVGTANVAFSAGTYSGTILVGEVLKGKAVTGSAIPISWIEPPNAMRIRVPGRAEKPLQLTGIFFLQAASGPFQILTMTSGAYSFAQLFLPTIPGASRGPIAAAVSSQAKTALDRIALEVLASFEVGLPSRYDLAGVYKDTRSPVLLAAFKSFKMSTDKELAALGHAGSIATGDASSIEAIHQNAKTLSTAQRWDSVLFEIQQFRDPANVNAITALENIVSDQSALLPLRQAAGISLGAIHARHSLPYLAALLTEPSLTLRTAAVGGLALFANDVAIGASSPGARPSPYRDDQTIAHSAWDERIVGRDGSYTSFWQAWWLTHRAELTASAY